MPSWWRGLSADVRAAWIDAVPVEERIVFDDVQCAQEHVQCYGYTFRVPGSVKEINEVLRYEVRKEPYINAMSQQERGPQFLEIGRRGSIILEGGRLWRGTVVTIGQQRASRITALPDMNGVIADFDCVLPPAGLDHKALDHRGLREGRRLTVPVTVWTSEGRTSTPYVVHLMPFAGSESNGDRPCFLPARTAGVSR